LVIHSAHAEKWQQTAAPVVLWMF